MVPFTRLRVEELANIWDEGSQTPSQIALLGVFDATPFLRSDGSFDADAVRRELLLRADRVPALARRVIWTRFGEGRPVWADDPSYDPSRHLECITLPDGEDFLDWSTDRTVRRLDLDRLLWRIEIVDGLPGGGSG